MARWRREVVSPIGPSGCGKSTPPGMGSGRTAMVLVTINMLTLIGIAAYGAVVPTGQRGLHDLPKAEKKST
jgi:ABC-type uncharacterized transport system YnjBCD ATPase subunit